MYAYFPLLLVAMAAAMLGTWLIQDAGFRRAPWLAWPGRCLLGLLPLVIVGLAGNSFFAPASRAASPWLIGVLAAAGALLLAAGVATLIARVRLRRAPDPLRPGLLGPTLLIPAIGIISACFLLSVLLALTNGTLAFGR
jgi:hypothetical protein